VRGLRRHMGVHEDAAGAARSVQALREYEAVRGLTACSVWQVV
jgi:hypothetical protein